VRHVPDVRRLGTQGRRRALTLRVLVATLIPPLADEEKRRVSFATVEALNLWAGFARAMYVSTALSARDQFGARIATAQPGLRTVADAITFAVHSDKPKLATRSGPWTPFDEPSWATLNSFENVMVALNPSNLSAIIAGVSYDPNAFRDLKQARNFFAHRSESTARHIPAIARRNLLSPTLHPVDLLCSRPRGRPQTLIADWIDAVRSMIERCAL
jgi:hypothetical protein